MRRLVLAVALVALAGSSGGCFAYQYFFYDLLIQATMPPGEWSKFMCSKFPLSPFEFLEGDYRVQGDFEQGAINGPFARKLLYMIEGRDAEWNRIGRPIRGNFKVDKKTGMFDSVEPFRELVIPMGGAMCFYLKPKGGSIDEGDMLSYFNLQMLTTVAEQGSPAPGR